MGHLLGRRVKILDPDYDEQIGRVIRVVNEILEVEIECPELGNSTALMFEKEIELVVDNE